MSNLVWDCVKNLPNALFRVHLLRWIATYPLDKVIRSLNNRGLVANNSKPLAIGESRLSTNYHWNNFNKRGENSR